MPFPPTHPALERALAQQGYLEPTPVQAAVLAAPDTQDLLVSAQTGSGKTVAFGLAAARGLLGEAPRFERAGPPLALVIAPTRELALQVSRELNWLYAQAGALVVNCVGGMDPRAERRGLQAGCHIVVGTPGRLRDHLERGALDLSALRVVVLDEADEMLDLGFREDLEAILDSTPDTRRTLMFSATIAKEIASAAQEVEVAIVVGGGNFFRGAELSQRGMDRGRADYMGMLGTVMNALALQDFLEQAGAATRVQSAISMTQVAEPYIPRRAERHLEKGRIVIFGAGAGLPYFSTDTVAAQRALEIDAHEVLVAKNGVDGVYTADPKKDASAEKLHHVTYQDALLKGLKVVDATAFSLCMDNGMPMHVFGMEGAGNVAAAIRGERIGTVVSN